MVVGRLLGGGCTSALVRESALARWHRHTMKLNAKRMFRLTRQQRCQDPLILGDAQSLAKASLESSILVVLVTASILKTQLLFLRWLRNEQSGTVTVVLESSPRETATVAVELVTSLHPGLAAAS